MKVAQSVSDVLKNHVVLEVEGIDRMYLNVYVPTLQAPEAVAYYLRYHRGNRFASSVLLEPITEGFLKRIDRYTKRHGIPVVPFEKGQRKDDVAKEALSRYGEREGVLFVGKAQEKAAVVRTERRKSASGGTYPWLVRSTAMINQYYFYIQDADFGPLFLKFCSYFPYNAKLCINGHEYVKRQLKKEGIAFEALDNGVLSCADPKRLQALCDGLSAEKIDRLLRKWLSRLPHPFSPEDQQVGCCYQASILQAEFSLTQVLDQPVNGRIFFEEVIRENLDLGRPSQVQLIFDRRVNKRTPGRFRTRVITDGVVPSLHVDYKRSRIKQYHKEGRALRTETTINDTRDFGVGRLLKNLPALRKIGFQANRRLLDVQQISHDCHMGEAAFQAVNQPVVREGQRASALRYADPRTQALLTATTGFVLQPCGFRATELRDRVSALRGEEITPGQMTYNLRRLRLHGIIERLPGTHRYRLTDAGLRCALFWTRSYARLLRPGMSELHPSAIMNPKLRRAFDAFDATVTTMIEDLKLAS
ncbi:MAG: hypothetical protein AAB403_16710 [Planctomycetota bacterium]